MLSRDIQTSVRNDKKEHLENLAMQAEIADNQNRLNDVYEITKSIAGKVSKSGFRTSETRRDHSLKLMKIF